MGGMSTTQVDSRQVLAEVEASNRFLIQQVFKPIANEYRISIPRRARPRKAGRSSSSSRRR